MSIELKQAAQQAVDAFDAFGNADDFASLFALTQKMNALRTAIQQPASEEHLFEFWWEAHMPNANKENAWSAFTAAIASNRVGIAAQQPATPEPVADGLPLIVAGAIFDFAGFLTTRAEVIEVGSTANAGPVADLVKEWAELRGLNLADAAVLSWQLHITRASLPAHQTATPEPAAGEWFCGNCRVPVPGPAAPQSLSVPKDDQIAALVNKVRDIARMFHDHQSLRERIAIELVPALKASQDVQSNAERWLYAIADSGNQSMNFMDIFGDWDGDGSFVEAFDKARLADKKEGGAA